MCGGELDPHHAGVLEQHREAMLADKQHWGDAVFAQLQPVPALPYGEMLVMSPIPALLVVAEKSESCRLRCIAFIDAQVELIRSVLSMQAPKRVQTLPVHTRLQKFSQTYVNARRLLHERALPVRKVSDVNPEQVERWLQSSNASPAKGVSANAC
jgi:hypothetical protein